MLNEYYGFGLEAYLKIWKELAIGDWILVIYFLV